MTAITLLDCERRRPHHMLHVTDLPYTPRFDPTVTECDASLLHQHPAACAVKGFAAQHIQPPNTASNHQHSNPAMADVPIAPDPFDLGPRTPKRLNKGARRALLRGSELDIGEDTIPHPALGAKLSHALRSDHRETHHDNNNNGIENSDPFAPRPASSTIPDVQNPPNAPINVTATVSGVAQC
ncbi:hypothetical protein EDB80DRAFT_894646 [Ilyonectria destructans]|nr:hypothetical protein EDB80DRAFT_894646 [Ilyonectria destructans]